MAVIKQLDTQLANMIAAGEVVERPAAAVKELVENSIDAHATAITVEIKNGGLSFIRVTDNGVGMSSDDAKTAFLRHATSKISTKEDLANIRTLGFRGEALAAISAVSHVDLFTKQKGEVEGTAVVVEAGRVEDCIPAGCAEGTTVIIRDLFYNTPARLKFMKKDTTEAAHVYNSVLRAALSHPDISFTFIKDGNESFSTSGDGNLKSSIYSTLGREFAEELVAVEYSKEGVSVSGFVTLPHFSKNNRKSQYFFVNGRPVQSKTLWVALEEAYKNRIMVGKSPACVLNICIDAKLIDVNVHPTKAEIKFSNERQVFDAIYFGVKTVLETDNTRKEVKQSSTKLSSFAVEREDVRPYQEFLREVSSLVIDDRFESKTSISFNDFAYEEQKNHVTEEIKTTQIVEEKEINFRLIGEFSDLYVLVECNDELYVIDKHAAHERIIFERLKKEEQITYTQQLLSPEAIRLSKEETAVLLEYREELCGFEIEDFGNGTLIVRAVPQDVEDIEKTLSDIAEMLIQNRRMPHNDRRDEILHTIACKAAIKSGYKTSDKELLELVRQVLTLPDIKYCPHGRPVLISFTKSFLEKQFKRI